VKALPKPPGMTESGDEKKRIGDGIENDEEGIEKGRESNLMEYSENGTQRLKGFP